MLHDTHSSLNVPHCISNVIVSGKPEKFGYYTTTASKDSNQLSPLRSRLKQQSQQQQEQLLKPKQQPSRPASHTTNHSRSTTKEQSDTSAKQGSITVSTPE
jgi:hypothetical protein